MRVLVMTGKATSLLNVARDVAYVAHRRGHAPRIVGRTAAPSVVAGMADAVVLVYPTSPLFCAPYMLLYRDLKLLHGVPAVYYTMVEGRIRSPYVKRWMKRDVEFVACSWYVRDKLVESGLRVTGVVHHGLVREEVEKARALVEVARRSLRRMHGDRVVFAALSHTHPRKGLDRLAAAVRLLSERRKDFAVHLVSSGEASKHVSGVPNVRLDPVYGHRSRVEILAFLGAADFLVVPSLAEGFCLPLLEANAMGTPAVYCSYPPLTEVSDPRANVTFDYERVEYVNTGEGIEYEMHFYDPRELARAMEEAVELARERRGEYEDMSARAAERAAAFDAERLYSKLLEAVGA